MLRPEGDRPFGVEDPSIQRYADERDNLGFEAPHLGAQQLDARIALVTAQSIDAWRLARNEVGNAEAPLRQPIVGAPVDRFGHELRFKKEFPETVGVSREVVAGLGGPDARVDADKQHADARCDAIAERQTPMLARA